jgi:excisionase family DNA binding protein
MNSVVCSEDNVGRSLDKLVGKTAVAEYFDVTVRTVEYWMRAKKIPFYKVAGTVRFRLSEIEQALARCRVREVQ